MRITPLEVTIRDVVEAYRDDNEGGVTGYGGRLNIRPPYQREFVYDAKQRTAVMETIRRNFPLNSMYWAVNHDGSYEVMDGQQRTISFCQYVAGDFSVEIDGNPMAFHNLTQPQKDRILDYQLLVYACEGEEDKKLDWFRTINIAGLKLTDQELRNAVYAGPWLTHAKSIFSRTNGAGAGLSSKYVNAVVNRQGLLEKALKWKSGGKIEAYMSEHQHDPNANELWTYFQNVIWWVQQTFTTYRREMKGVEWGPLYDQYKDEVYDTDELETRTVELRADRDVQSKKGIYAYLLTGDKNTLNLRQFEEADRIEVYERQGGRCARGMYCKTVGNDDGKQVFDITEMEADHITPWSKGGSTNVANCQMLCLPCNRSKGGL